MDDELLREGLAWVQRLARHIKHYRGGPPHGGDAQNCARGASESPLRAVVGIALYSAYLITVSTIPISTRRFFSRASGLFAFTRGLDLPKPLVVMISGGMPDLAK